MVIKYFLCMFRVILAVPVLALIALAIKLPITISGIGYLLASLLVIMGLVLAPRTQRHYLLIVAGVLWIILIASTRIFLGERNLTSNLSMVTLPREKGTRWLGYVIDEQDGLIFGETLFHFVGGSSVREHETITQSLYKDYSDMRQAQGIVPSPILNTYLNLQSRTAFDAVIIEPENRGQPEFGVIFLHGYMGNVSAQCWVIAQAVKKLGGVTVCPSTGWRGQWWLPQGQIILKNTFDYLTEQGIQQIYLGGYSNGGFGIGRLASQLGNEKELSGLFFIDGFANSGSIREIGLPILIIQGILDERVPASSARQFAGEIGDLGTYVELNTDHFLIMKQPNLVQDVLANWLRDRQPGK